MIPVHCLRGKKVALFGLGDSGLATAAALVAGGADVILWDDYAGAVAKAREQGFFTEDLRKIAWKEIAALVLAPGVPLTHPRPHWSVELAAAHDVEVIGDIELFVRERNDFLRRKGLGAQACPFIAVTGTNGKSTTTMLIAHLLEAGGCDVQMGGNIGTAILSLEPLAEQRFYVIECSSYQIDLARSINPTVGILLNLTPDHVDRHGSFEHYAAIKQRLAAAAAAVIIGLDDVPCRRIYEHLKADRSFPVKVETAFASGQCDKQKNSRFIHCFNKRWIDLEGAVLPVATGMVLQEGCFAKGRTLLCAQGGKLVELASLEGVSSLRGQHNAQNALAALVCCSVLGIDSGKIKSALASFQGLPHRMEEVGRKGHVLFINDSKATNADAAAPALAAFDHIYWIAGGVSKEGGILPLQKFFSKIRKAYLIGEAAAGFAKTIGDTIPVILSGTLANAVRQAARDAAADKAGEAVVLFSPACASFDQFANYSVRGDTFRKLVQGI